MQDIKLFSDGQQEHSNEILKSLRDAIKKITESLHLSKYEKEKEIAKLKSKTAKDIEQLKGNLY